MLGGKGVKSDDGISKRSCCSDVFPGESGQARLGYISREVAESLGVGVRNA